MCTVQLYCIASLWFFSSLVTNVTKENMTCTVLWVEKPNHQTRVLSQVSHLLKRTTEIRDKFLFGTIWIAVSAVQSSWRQLEKIKSTNKTCQVLFVSLLKSLPIVALRIVCSSGVVLNFFFFFFFFFFLFRAELLLPGHLEPTRSDSTRSAGRRWDSLARFGC